MSRLGFRPASRSFIALAAACALILAPTPGRGAEVARLRPGAIEVGLAGSVASVAGSTRASVALRLGSFRAAGSGLAGFEAELGYTHVQALDTVDLGGNVSWQHAAGASSLHPFFALGGGLRQETLGSFSQARYPVGFALGLRALVGPRAALRVEYRYRRILNDPVANFTEHDALVGLSILLRNPERPGRGGE